jgi:hypothetical protein
MPNPAAVAASNIDIFLKWNIYDSSKKKRIEEIIEEAFWLKPKPKPEPIEWGNVDLM